MPQNHLAVKAGAFVPVERELVFDIDLTDYDDVRTCCSGAKICSRCWSYMTMAVSVYTRKKTATFLLLCVCWGGGGSKTSSEGLCRMLYLEVLELSAPTRASVCSMALSCLIYW